MRRPVACAVLATLLAGCLGAPAPIAATELTGVPLGLACPPPCGATIASGAGASAEPTIAADPEDPAHLVAGSFVYEAGPAGTTTFWLYAHVSDDGGRSWTTHRLPGGPAAGPGHPLATYTNTGDPSVVVLPGGRVLYAGIAARGGLLLTPVSGVGALSDLAVFVATSEDGGRTFPRVDILAEGIGAFGGVFAGPLGVPIFTPMDFQDKEMLARGADGTIVLAWTNVQIPSQRSPGQPFGADVLARVSEDDGASWGPPRLVAKGPGNSGAAPAVGTDGALHVAFLSARDGSLDPPYALAMATSRDGGDTWHVDDLGDVAPLMPGEAAPTMPTLQVGRGPEGGERLWLGYALPDGGDARPAVRWSDDGAVSWQGPVLLEAPKGPGNPLTALGVDATGSAYAAYYHPLDEQGNLEFRVAAVGPDGAGPPLTVGTGLRPGFARRDYTGIVGLERGAYAVWVGGEMPDTNLHGAAVARAAG